MSTQDKLQQVFAKNPNLKTHYDFLVNKKQVAETNLNNFIKRIINEDEGSEEIRDIDKAIDYTKNHILTDPQKRKILLSLVKEQEKLIKSFELSHNQLKKNDKSSQFYLDCHKRLESFSVKCLVEFKRLQIPLFIKDSTNDELTTDRLKLLLFIQQEIQ